MEDVEKKDVEKKEVTKASSPRWFIWLMILVLAAALWLLYRGFGNSTPPATVAPQPSPVAGGMVVAPAAAITTTASVEPTKLAGLQPGQTVAASGDAGLRLYADANLNASIMDVYAAGALFTVLEPSDAYSAYPVENDNSKWYRLRAADGLVGWAHADSFTPAPNAPKATATPAG